MSRMREGNAMRNEYVGNHEWTRPCMACGKLLYMKVTRSLCQRCIRVGLGVGMDVKAIRNKIS